MRTPRQIEEEDKKERNIRRCEGHEDKKQRKTRNK